MFLPSYALRARMFPMLPSGTKPPLLFRMRCPTRSTGTANVAHCLKRKTVVNIRTLGGQRPTVTRGQLPSYIAAAGHIPVRVMLIVDPARGRGLCHGTGRPRQPSNPIAAGCAGELFDARSSAQRALTGCAAYTVHLNETGRPISQSARSVLSRTLMSEFQRQNVSQIRRRPRLC